MTVLGVDYAWQHPDPAALAAAGYRFACRYLSRDLSKNLTLAEAQALAAHGIYVVANWEYGAEDALRGRSGGIADAELALAQATAAGMPANRPIYFSADWDVTPEQEATVSAYLSGLDSVLGVAETGEYAGFYPVKIARDSGLAAWTWQTFGWSGGQWDPRDQIRQTGTATVGGVQVDVNQAMMPDFGQWMPGLNPFAPTPAPPAPPTTVEDDEMSTSSQSGRAGLAWAAGSKHVFEVNYGAAGAVDLVLNAELKLTSGPLYLQPLTVPHTLGTGSFEIPQQYIAACRGVILTVKSGPADVVYDVCAV